MDTKALKLAAVAATMLDDFDPSTWAPLPSLGQGIRVLVTDSDRSLVATAHTDPGDSADVGPDAEAGRIYAQVYPHADFTWPRVCATAEIDSALFGTAVPTEVTLSEPLPGAPVGDEPIADIARASSLAQTLATIHSAAPEPVSDAGFAVDDPARFQFQILERLDQAAGSGRVPARLLQHWEEEFEKVALWHFLATPIHGGIDETSVYTDQERVLALGRIGRLRVSDPAIDLAAASALLDPVAHPTFYEEYRRSRPRADDHIEARAELLAEFAVLDWLVEAVEAEDEDSINDAADLLTSFSRVLFPDADAPTADVKPHSSDVEAQADPATAQEADDAEAAAPIDHADEGAAPDDEAHDSADRTD